MIMPYRKAKSYWQMLLRIWDWSSRKSTRNMPCSPSSMWSNIHALREKPKFLQKQRMRWVFFLKEIFHLNLLNNFHQKIDYNLAPIYDPNYPVMFNIILWFSIILIFTLLAISLSIARMEDKDSIIYRMTSTRMKKDN